MNLSLSQLYPCLTNLLQGYFNCDWIYDYPDWESALGDWLKSSVESRNEMIHEISTALNKYDETELKEFFSSRQMASGIQPPDYGHTYTDWLKEVRRQFEATL